MTKRTALLILSALTTAAVALVATGSPASACSCL